MLHPYDPAWPGLAERLIAVLRRASSSHPDWIFDHIGSTSVPGLAAKNIIDLQIRVPALPTYDELDDIFGIFGYRRALGARPDSPGCTGITGAARRTCPMRFGRSACTCALGTRR